LKAEEKRKSKRTSAREKSGWAGSAASAERRTNMNKDILKGKWQEIKGTAKEKWSKLMDDDLGELEGRGERLLGLLQKKYGYIREKAEQDYTDSVELGEIVSGLREIMIKKRDFVPFAFIARYGQSLLSKKQENSITETEEKHGVNIDHYSRYRPGRRTSHLAS
jgi:uncharacterized protein YjbJ (UPF0337 family)